MNRFVTCVLVVVAGMAGSPPALAMDQSLDRALIGACFKLDVNEVVRCLRNGADVNARFGEIGSDNDAFADPVNDLKSMGSESWTPLMALVNSPALSVAIEDNEQQNASTERISKKIRKSRHRDAATILLLLMANRCDLNSDDGHGATALFMAVDDDKIDLARILLEFGANPNTKTGVYIDGTGDLTPLHIAFRSKKLLKLLLEHGADPSVKDSKGRTPSEWVALVGDRDFDLIVTSKGAVIQRREK